MMVAARGLPEGDDVDYASGLAGLNARGRRG
jgi:hypothetical protein